MQVIPVIFAAISATSYYQYVGSTPLKLQKWFFWCWNVDSVVHVPWARHWGCKISYEV